MNADSWLLPALVASPLAGVLGARSGRPRVRAVHAGAALLGLALAAFALAHTRAGALSWAPIAGAWMPGLVLDRASAWMLLLLAALAALASLSAPRVEEPGAARRAAGFACLVTMACLSANLAWQLAAFLLAAAGAAERLARRSGPGAERARIAVGAITACLVLALGCIALGAGSFDSTLLSVRAPAATGADGEWLAAAAYLLFVGLASASLALPLALALPAAAGVRLRLAALALGGLAAWLLMRDFTLVFPCFTAGPCGAVQLALPLALAALSSAALGTLFARTVRELVAFLLLVLLSTPLLAVGSFRAGGFAAALFELGHALLAGAALVLAAEPGVERRGAARALLPAALIVAAGAPPAGGFVGLIAVLRASGPDALAVWTLSGAATLIVVAAIRRVLAETALASSPAPAVPSAPGLPAVLALGACLALGLFARPAFDYADIAARQLFDRAGYAGHAGGSERVGSAAAARHYPATAPAAVAADPKEGT